MKEFCDTEDCENKAGVEVPVSENSYGDSTRSLCGCCHSAYMTGLQHAGMFVRPRANYAVLLLENLSDRQKEELADHLGEDLDAKVISELTSYARGECLPEPSELKKDEQQ